MRKILIVSSLLSAGFACSNAKLESAHSGTQSVATANSQDATGNNDSGNKSQAADSAAGESADRPVSITGAYLNCSSLLDATNVSLTTVIGCRATGVEVRTNYSIDYSLKPAAVPGVTTTQTILTDANRKNDVIFQFTAATKAASLQGARESQVVMKVRDLATGVTESRSTLKIGNALSNKSELPEFKMINFEGSDLYYFVDEQTGMNWSVDNGIGYTFSQASAYCNDFGVGDDTFWRLPTITELQTLYNSEPLLVVGMNVSSLRNGGHWSSTLDAGPNTAWRINLAATDVNSATNAIDVNTAQSVICIR